MTPMLYLSRLILNLRSRRVQQELANVYELHRTIMTAFPGGCRQALGLRSDRQYVLFLGNPADPNKNITLAREAVQRLGRPDVELLHPYPTSHEQVVQYLNSTDVFVLCSFGEGSPNVIKEAMACNCPVVSTPAGDAAWVLGDTPGCYIADYSAGHFAEALQQALHFAREHGRTRGRERLLALGLDAETVAWRIESVYRRVLRLPPVPAPEGAAVGQPTPS